MGNDGGSIPKRDDLVKTRRTAATTDPRDRQRQLFFFCALSKQPLTPPVVSCPLGKLYNKDALLAHFLDPPSATSSGAFGNDGKAVVAHLRGLRDVTTLTLTPNPAFAPAATYDESATATTHAPAPFICPVSLREMNGTAKFVYRRPGGAVLSDAALREMRRGLADDDDALYVCPVTGERFPDKETWVTLNPVGDELDAVTRAWDAQKLREKEEKKALKDKKRKQPSTTAPLADDPATTAPPPKKTKLLVPPPAPSVHPNMSVPRLSATLAAQLAEQKKAVSPAIASLYAPKDDGTNKDKDGRSNWMTRGAFTRYA